MLYLQNLQSCNRDLKSYSKTKLDFYSPSTGNYHEQLICDNENRMYMIQGLWIAIINGLLMWATEAGLGSLEGGGSWGAATDEKRTYTNIANIEGMNFTLKPSNKTTNSGGWVAIDA